MKTRFPLVLAVFVAALCFASSAHATIQRVVVVQTADIEAYVKELEKGQQLLEKMGSVQVLRVWRPRFGGEAGTVMVCVEYADLAAMAADDKKVAAHAEFQAWLKQLGKLRKIVSDSLYDEMRMTPRK